MNIVEAKADINKAATIDQIIKVLAKSNTPAVASEFANALMALFSATDETRSSLVAAAKRLAKSMRIYATMLRQSGQPSPGIRNVYINALGEFGLSRYAEEAGGPDYYAANIISSTISSNMVPNTESIKTKEEAVDAINEIESTVRSINMPTYLEREAIEKATKSLRRRVGFIVASTVKDNISKELEDVSNTGGPADIRRFSEAINRHIEAMPEADRNRAIYQIDAYDLVEQAARKATSGHVEQIGPEHLPVAIKQVITGLRSEQAIIGSLKADSAHELKLLINRERILAKNSMTDLFQERINQISEDLSRKFDGSFTGDQDQDRQLYQEQIRKEWESIKQQHDQAAMERVAEQAGLTVAELERQVGQLETRIVEFAAERERVGERLLNEIRKLHLPADEAETIKARKVTLDATATKLLGRDTERWIGEFVQMVGGGLRDGGKVEIMSISALKKKHPDRYQGRGVKRAFCSPGIRRTDGSRDLDVIGIGTQNKTKAVLWHEMGHWLEHHNPIVRAMVAQWYERRTAGEKPVKLSTLHPNSRYGRDEITKRDNFIDAYMGKVYQHGATEIVSMGLEYLSSPEKAAMLAEKDPDMLSLILKIIEVVNEK